MSIGLDVVEDGSERLFAYRTLSNHFGPFVQTAETKFMLAPVISTFVLEFL